MISPRGLRIFLSVLLVISLSRVEAKKSSDEGKAEEKAKNPLARGWGDSIDWVTLEEGQERAREERKPVMLLIHKTWCGACQTLKGKFAKAKMIAELAKSFIMVNAEDDEEPWEEEFQPDGGKYIPRIFFISPDGQLLKDVINPKDEYKQYPYYYSNPAPIIHAMQSVLQKFGMPVPGDDKKKKEAASKSKEDDAKKDEKPDEPKEPEPPKKKEEPKKGECPNMAKAKKEAQEKADLPRKGKKIESGEAPGDDKPKPPAQTPPEKEL